MGVSANAYLFYGAAIFDESNIPDIVHKYMADEEREHTDWYRILEEIIKKLSLCTNVEVGICGCDEQRGYYIYSEQLQTDQAEFIGTEFLEKVRETEKINLNKILDALGFKRSERKIGWHIAAYYG